MEDKVEKSSRASRTRRPSNDDTSSVGTPKKSHTSRKFKGIDENPKEGASRRNSVDDDDKSSNASSTAQMMPCKVILRREQFDDMKTDDRAIAHSTRSRRNSQLTEENIADMNDKEVPSKRVTRSNSFASDGSETTTRTRSSARLAASQNTPKSEASTAPISARRSSRLRSENEKAADSPARRNLRSNSTISEPDTVSPPQRRSSRLVETGTPKSLKTAVSKIKKEPTTPRRASMRVNMSIIATDIIDEESDEESESASNKGKESTKANANERDTQSKGDTSKDGNQLDKSIILLSPVIVMEREPEDVKPVLTDEQIELANKIIESSTASAAISKPAAAAQSPIVLVTATTVSSPKSNIPSTKAQTPTVQPAEPMDTCVDDAEKVITPTGTPKRASRETPKKPATPAETTKTPQKETKGQQKPSNELDSFSVTEKEAESNNENEKPKGADVEQPSTIEQSADHVEPMDVSEIAPEADNNELTSEVVNIYSNKAIESIKKSAMSTPKHKSRASNAFESMDVSALAHDSARPESTKSPERKSLNKSKSFLNESDEQMPAETSVANQEPAKEVTSNENVTPKAAKTPQKMYFKVLPSPKVTGKSPKKGATGTPQKGKTASSEDATTSAEKRPLNRVDSSFGDVSFGLRGEIDKLVAEFETTTTDKETDHEEVDRRIDEIAAATTPVEEVDRQINEIAAEAESIKVVNVDEATVETSNTEVTAATAEEKKVDSQDESKEKPESDAAETVPEGEPAATSDSTPVSNTSRKSVQIMTPKMEKSQSATKRIDTPYPDEKSIHEASLKSEQTIAKSKKRAEARELLKSTFEQWSTSIKRAIADGAPIDCAGVNDRSKQEVPAKKFVAARNTWSNKMGESESEDENEDIVQESEQSDVESEASKNEFVDDEAKEVENYQSGDSMDEEERREIIDNEIVEGMSLGSNDTNLDEVDIEEEHNESDDDFIDDDEVSIVSNSEEAEEEESTDDESDDERVQAKPKRRSSAIIQSSSSEDSSDGEVLIIASNDASNEVVSVSMHQVESVVVINGDRSDAEQIIEGKTFATTYIMPANELPATESAMSDLSKSTTVTASSSETKAEEEKVEATEEKIEQEPTSALAKEDESVEKQEEATEEVVEAKTTDEVTEQKQNESEAKTVDDAKPLQTVNSAPPVLSGKKNPLLATKIDVKHRSSLPGITSLQKTSKNKLPSRVSLGDLNPNARNADVGKRAKQTQKVPSAEKEEAKPTPIRKKQVVVPVAEEIIDIQNDSHAEPQSDSDDSSAVEYVQASDTDEESCTENTPPLNISSQEENNNQKISSKKVKVVKQITADEIIPSVVVKEQEYAVTSTSLNETSSSFKPSKSLKSKRKFQEVDVDEEPRVRPKPKKLLRVVNSASGKFLEEPMTPEKSEKHGFKVTPKTPVNPNFKVEKRVHLIEPGRSNKRKSVYISVDEDEDVSQMLLPQPKWKINTQFDDYERPSKRARKLELGSTEVIIQPAQTKKAKKDRMIPSELQKYRHNLLFRAGIPRQSSYDLLRMRQKKLARK